jgi:hypothetical protein
MMTTTTTTMIMMMMMIIILIITLLLVAVYISNSLEWKMQMCYKMRYIYKFYSFLPKACTTVFQLQLFPPYKILYYYE